MNKILLLIISIFLINTVLANEFDEFSKELGWENKWNRITESSITSYIERTKEGQMEGLSHESKEQASIKIKKELKKNLGWSGTGKTFILNISKSCDAGTLRNLVALKSGNSLESMDRNLVINNYKACMQTAIKDTFNNITRAIISFKADKDAIINQYRT
jgi:hypothetical protein